MDVRAAENAKILGAPANKFMASVAEYEISAPSIPGGMHVVSVVTCARLRVYQAKGG